MDVHVLPTVNACLNAVAAALLLAGYLLIRKQRIDAHRNCMLAAFVVSSLFLACYLYYHARVGSKPFRGAAALRWVYFPILISHIVLAVAIVPLALTTLYYALRQRFDRHRQIARWTWPLWMYVSVTGVIVYLMLYQLPQGN